MLITPTDISKFAYCPFGWNNKLSLPIEYRRFNIFQSSIVQSILEAEESCLLKESDINPRKILRKWDSLWWEKAGKNNISIKDAEKLSIDASLLFSDYCKYDITDYHYPTVGINIIREKYIESSIVKAKADLIKVNLAAKKRNFTIVSFGNKKISPEELYLNPYVWTIINTFSLGNEDITYSYFGILDKQKTFYSTSIIFRVEEIKRINKYIKFFIGGIKKNIDYRNLTKCKECNQCQILNL